MLYGMTTAFSVGLGQHESSRPVFLDFRIRFSVRCNESVI